MWEASVTQLAGAFLRAYTVDKMITLHKKRCCLLVELKRKKVVDIHHKYNNNSKCLNYNYSI